MGLAGELKKRMEKQDRLLTDIMDKMSALDVQYREATAYMQALADMFKMLPKEDQESEDVAEVTMRAGSLVAQARDVLRKRGEAMHVNELLKAMGKDSNSKKDRLSLSGSLALYVRKEQVFTRPMPNVFGLREWPVKGDVQVNDAVEEQIEVDSKGILPIRPIAHRTN